MKRAMVESNQRRNNKLVGRNAGWVHIVVILLVLFVLAFGILLGVGIGGDSGKDDPRSKTSVLVIMRERIRAAEFTSLKYNYNVPLKDMPGNRRETITIAIPGTNKKIPISFTIPFTGKKLLATIEGTIHLGIDCSEIDVATIGTNNFVITLPPIKILSHEINKQELFDKKGNYSPDEIWALESGLKDSIASGMLNNPEIISDAENATIDMLRSILAKIPDLGSAQIAFNWKLRNMPFEKAERPSYP
jgi:hypothetical protein